MPGTYRDLPGHLARKQQEETEEEELEVRAGGSRDVPVNIKMCVSKQELLETPYNLENNRSGFKVDLVLNPD